MGIPLAVGSGIFAVSPEMCATIFHWRGAAFLGVTILFAGCMPSGNWRAVSERGRILWQADAGNWRAEVDPSRGRLSYLGPKQGPNFLSSPSAPPDNLQFGGHRAWLGPQSEWKPFWPPPQNWESSPARSVTLRRPELLEIESPAGKGDAVSIRRTYRWLKNSRLECGVSWQESSSVGRQSMQIFQLKEGVVFEARAKPAGETPRGFVRLPIGPRPTTARNFAWPAHASRSGTHIQLQRRSQEEKLGFRTQKLIARWPGGEIVLHPGRITGRVSGEPDKGYNSQIYLGADERPAVEFEQLSPRLAPHQPGDRVGQTVVLELRRH